MALNRALYSDNVITGDDYNYLSETIGDVHQLSHKYTTVENGIWCGFGKPFMANACECS